MNFTSPPAIFASSFVIGLSGALMPGPLLAVTVRDTTRRGFVAAPLLVLGHGILESILLLLLAVGLAEWVRGERVTTTVALGGAAMLLWMAVGMLREVRILKLETGPGGGAGGAFPERGARNRLRPVLDGIVASVSNPYWTLWWATIGLGYLAIAAKAGPAGIAAFFVGHLLADASWYLLVGAMVSAGRGRFTDTVYRWVVGVCAAFLFFFALSFGYFGVSKLIRML